MTRKTRQKQEYGDFQTPSVLAAKAVSVLGRLGFYPQTVLEPTCGKGSFLVAAIEAFPDAQRFIGVDVNEGYVRDLQERVSTSDVRDRVQLICGDFFYIDWPRILASAPEPILVIGNPPWVTNSDLGALQSKNIPLKSNFQGRRGYDAITGKSNFDISEWMLLKHLAWLTDRHGVIAMLCKTAVARKVLCHAWRHNLPVSLSHLSLVDAKEHFDASVDACFLILDVRGGASSGDCLLYDKLGDAKPSRTIGYHDGLVLSDVRLYQRWRHLKGLNRVYVWRSGVKHDCSKVMELQPLGTTYRNALDELVALEGDYVYPMLKSSDVGNGSVRSGRRYMLVTQRYVGEDTTPIRSVAPKTWRYLEDHEAALAKRSSSIYRNRPRFSIFGVGPYTFAPWKVAISGFYKNLSFKVISPFKGKCVMLDDTISFLPCWSESEASFVAGLLNSKPTGEFYESMVFWADKRPITIEVLKRLDLRALSRELGCEETYLRFSEQRQVMEVQPAAAESSTDTNTGRLF